MTTQNSDHSFDDDEVESYADDHIASGHAPIPRWLQWSYIIIPIWGAASFIYWNGSFGWLDPGYWNQLQKAANTTYPYININHPNSNTSKDQEQIPNTISFDEKKSHIAE